VVAFFLTGFILPVRSFGDRLQVLRRVVANWLDQHGTAWVIEDGRLRHRTEQERMHGVGVILQDANSAAVFDQHLGQPQVSGEQVTFTDKDEHLVWQTELRRRQLLIGPQHDDPDPFRTRGSNEERAEYRARQYRRRVAAGKTSDGVELVATLRVVYSLEGGAVSDQDEFGYEPGTVMRMYQGERPFPFDRNTDPVKYWRRRQSIEPLLEKFASDVWKLTCSRYTLAELFPPLYQNNASLGQPSAMQTIQTMLTDLLVDRQAGVLDGFGDATNIVEIREVFRELEGGQRPGGSRIGKSADPGRGVRVHEVKLEGISLSDDDTQRLLQQWIDDWRQGNPHPPVDTQVRADQEALIHFAEYAVQYFKVQPGSQPQIQRLVDSLVRLLQGTLRALPPGEDRERLLAATRQLGGSER
jgi:hypothetical protein